MKKSYVFLASLLVVANCLTVFMPSVAYYTSEIAPNLGADIVDGWASIMKFVNPILAIIATICGIAAIWSNKNREDSHE
jgi:hypothetical protein